MASEKSAQNGPLVRGVKKNNLLGTAVFFTARGLEPFLQYGILARGWGSSLITALRCRPLPTGPPLITNTLFDKLELSPYRAIIFGMSVAASLKQNFYLLAVQNEEVKPVLGVVVGTLNALFNSVNSLLFVCAQTSASVNGEHFPQTPLIVGGTLFAVGLSVEWFSEVQRALWKRDPANKGQIYKGGLFSLSRHVNYFGYQLWRTGYAIASGGWLWGALTSAFFAYMFVGESIPGIQAYMEERYGEKFKEYEREVPYKFVPFIW